ncbi:hypothetical protein F5B22DRAFT_563218 [Xylaria bambusicola]|uniref:uncharacterized protein n=1 Tax=Xylaria bambusicola TaxID=326684 RepID=UPI00200755FF|nr:uncharacterized protein F5B22DRAFT_563218 [Xylaria bambusicola]KAI0503158.1 hypothetical protein F5B22DRAFT_563218 [Xylaria bambusicola]
MLHIRFHRRTPSNPTSPTLDRSSWDTTAVQPANLVPTDGVPAPDIRPRSATSAPYSQAQSQSLSQSLRDQNPPVLPPIARVVSADSILSTQSQNSDQKPAEDVKSCDEPKPLLRSPYNEQPKFIGGLALENYRREQAAMNQPAQSQRVPNAPPIASASPTVSPSGTSTSIPPFGSRPQQPVPPPAKPTKAPSFVSPTDLQNALPTGKRPPGARMTSDQSLASNPPVARDATKAKKGLPFLKNPMSTLLARRKTSQNIPDLTLSTGEPTYDPRIRGTRVHDFSNPRPWKPVVQPSKIGNESANSGDSQVFHSQHSTPAIQPSRAPPVPPKDEHSRSSRTSSSYSKGYSMDTTLSQRSRESSVTQLAETYAGEESTQRRKSALSKASMSRKASAASVKSSFSAIPRHMKSTSSRFSFDMIGAAEQEKLLEERHRQRQQDKASGLIGDRRDSRFDEFDEDGFDYDAMDYDDDLEERIPGVNADLDDYEEDLEAANDPDNDQDNFAGFVFQRSEPVSSLTSPYGPGLLPTPRDANGDIIGYARTGETPRSGQFPETSMGLLAEPSPNQVYNDGTTAGLGIQEPGAAMGSPKLTASQPPAQGRTHLSKDDELYFNDGLIHDFDGEGDGSAFDESIFDLNDTDQYGRPIPQVFANALAQRNAALETKKRESDMTSRLSAQSAVSHSTAHTSLSVEAHAKSAGPQDETTTSHIIAQTCDVEDISHMTQPLESQQAISGLEGNVVAAYQAALAAAAHKAAASGKFRRDSSPEPPRDFTVTSPTTSGSSYSQQDAVNETELADYEYDDGFSAGLDDYELDDDAIIAEANASALANDSDGWYGQEFGFYSAPVPQSGYSQSSLSEKNIFQYSHGGYFGPSGVTRSTSGRVVSREPNLTPITERSEYSNRNSLMSIGWPQGPSSSGPIQSPGLAQLAMMAEDHDMSLSALLKLRNKAWGGSQVSLSSSREGSPYDRNGATSPQDFFAGGRKNSSFSIYSQDSAGAAGSDSGSPTLTMAIPAVTTGSIPSLANAMSPSISSASSQVFATTFPPLSEVEEPVSPEGKRPYRRVGSGSG